VPRASCWKWEIPSAPISVGRYVDWLHRQPDFPEPIGPLYLEQAKIERDLRDLKFYVARTNYINRLKAKTTMTAEDEMIDRLLAVAEERFLPKKAN